MTKLFVDDLIEYLRKNAPKASFEDYVFPEELSAEYIAERFHVSKIAALRRLNGLEEDRILVSKRAYVHGKPGKRLVFYPVDQLSEYDRFRSVSDGSLPHFGYKSLIFEKLSKTDFIEPTGHVRFTGEYKIKNVSKDPISEIPLPPMSFSTGESRDVYDKMVSLEVDGRQIPQSDGLRFQTKSEPGKCNEDLSYTKSKFHSTVMYVIPLDEPLKPSHSVQIKLVTDMPNAFTNIMDFEYAVVEIKEITLWASQRLIVPKGYRLQLLKRYKDTKYTNGILIRDKQTGIRKPDIEARITPPKVNGHSVYWVIDEPVLGYQYVLPFIAVEEKAVPSRSK